MWSFKLALSSLVCVSLSAHAITVKEVEVALAKPMDERVDELRQTKPASYSFLAAIARDKTKVLQIRWRAITTMGRLDTQHFRDDLNQALKSSEWFMRSAALIALQSDQRENAIVTSVKHLDDPALIVRTQAVRNLIQLNARETENVLWTKIFDKRNYKGSQSLWIRVDLAEALARFASPGRTRAFKRLLLDSDTRLHKWAILGLENSTGFKMSGSQEPLDVRRQKWLSKLGIQEI